MNDRLTVLQAQVDESQKAIDTLKPQIAANKKQLDALQKGSGRQPKGTEQAQRPV